MTLRVSLSRPVTAPADGTLQIDVVTAASVEVGITLYSTDGTTLLSNDAGWGVNSRIVQGGVAPGTYRVYKSLNYNVTAQQPGPTTPGEPLALPVWLGVCAARGSTGRRYYSSVNRTSHFRNGAPVMTA